MTIHFLGTEEPDPPTPPDNPQPSEPSADSFSDVKPGAYYADAVKWAVSGGITSGVGGGRFGPGKGCTRAEAVTFIWRAAGRPEPEGTADFVDMPSNPDFVKAISWAVENGVTSGVGNNRFGPSETCKREHIVTFLYNARDL